MRKGMNDTVAIALLALLSACGGEQAMESAPDDGCFAQELMDRTRPAKAEHSTVTRSTRLNGKVEYRPDNVVHYVSLIGGVINATYFELGDEVKRGQILADIMSTELTSLEAKRKTLTAELEVAERQVKTAKSLFEDGIGSDRDLLKAKSKVTSTRAKLERINANLAMFSASDRGDVFHIKAPVAGHVVSKQIAPGMSVVPEGEALFTISDLSQVWITVNIYPGDIGAVRKGMKADIRTVAYPDTVFQGSIMTIGQVFDEEEKVIKARIEMDNEHLRLKPGMFVDITLKDEGAATAVRIPSKALVFHDNRHYVVVHKDRCDVRSVPVEIVSKDNGDVFITGAVEPGEEVLTQNHLLIFQSLFEAKGR
jgi:cobalt-zinc-cadmium efflux system membrane fusion protein